MIRYDAHALLVPVDRVLTEHEVERVLPWWCRLLGIGDWRIEVAFVPERALFSRGRMAEVAWNANNRDAAIKMLRPADSDSETYDMERVLVHELVHIVLALNTGLLKDSVVSDTIENSVAVEQPVESLARALVGLARRHPDYPLRKRRAK